jgi:hypothetical protein
MTNPFEYSSPLAPDQLLDRDDEAQCLLARAEGSHNSRLVTPRRYGKTSLLLRVLDEAEHRGWAGVYVNFFGALSAADDAARPLALGGDASRRGSGRGALGSRGGTAAKAVGALIDAGDVVEEPSAVSRHRLVDPLFAAWVRAL